MYLRSTKASSFAPPTRGSGNNCAPKCNYHKHREEKFDMKRLPAIFLTAFFCLGGFLLLAHAQAQRKVKMTIPVVAHSMTPVYVAQSKGFFSDEKLDLDITSTRGGGPGIPGPFSGGVGIFFTTRHKAILA